MNEQAFFNFFISQMEQALPEELSGKKILCAFSGGPDSMALLDGLLQLGPKRGFAVCAAHFHHGIRGQQADEDRDFARAWCAGRGVEVQTGQGDAPAAAKERKCSLEDAARQLRYEFLQEQARKQQADFIALGHHLDDQAETVLFRLIRGSGLKGLGGMRPAQGNLLRPLLGMDRQQILDYLKLRGLTYRLDETNQSAEHSRNALRQLLQGLKEICPAADENIARAAQLLQQDEDTLEQLAQRQLQQARKEDGLSASALLEQPKAIRSRMLRLYAAEQGLQKDFEQQHVQDLIKLCRGQTGKRIALPQGFEGAVSYGVLTIGSPEAKEDFGPFPLKEGRMETPAGCLTIEKVPRPQQLGADFPRSIELSLEAVQGACIRSRQPGDSFFPLGAPGRKKLKDYWIDRKIPRLQRQAPLIARGKEVLAIPGQALSQQAQIGPGEQWVLRLTFEPLGTGSAENFE